MGNRTDDLRITRRIRTVRGRPDDHACLARAASRPARVRCSPGPLLANPLAQSVRDHSSSTSPSRRRRARSALRGRTPGGRAADDYVSAFHLRASQGAGLVSGLPALGIVARLPAGAKSGAVVLTEGVHFAVADARVRVDVRGVLNLILGHGQHDQLVAVEAGSADRREALPGPE
jgi:hypothetical protein